jgi:2-polyprenyl-3-methyl-5-hydroxy-6-metoxy-1,4-benzoquinol methylase
MYLKAPQMLKSKQIETDCPICGDNDTTLLWSEYPYKAVRCRKCGLIYVNPRSLQTELQKYYSEEYYRRNYLSASQRRLTFARERFKEIGEPQGKARLLDVGCGLGFFLKAAQEAGWQGFGLEPSEFASDYARNKYKLNVVTDTLLRHSYPEGYFEMVTMWDVLAHLGAPLDYLRKIHQILARDGLLVITTPNRPLLSFKIASLFSYFVTSGYYLHIPPQLYHFTPKTITKMLERADFKVLEVKFIKLPAPDRISSWFTKGVKHLISQLLYFITDRFHFHDYMIIYAQQEGGR